MICEFCNKALYRNDEPVMEHHPQHTEFIASADQGCLLCSMLLRDLIATASKNQSAAIANSKEVRLQYISDLQVTWPLFVGTLRDYGGYSRSGQVYMLTIRPTQMIESTSSGTFVELPTRHFCVYSATKYADHHAIHGLEDHTWSPSPGTLPKQVAEWLRQCSHEHENCHRLRPSAPTYDHGQTMPTRLLDISGKDDSTIRIVETAVAQIHAPYLTLSHCWGGPLPVKLVKQNYEEYKQAIRVADLPRTFREAVTVGRALDVQYIWIDALCIIQDDTEEWLREAPTMHDVYRNSYCNIAAVDSGNGEGGLFRERLPEDVSPPIIQASSAMLGKGTFRVVRRDFWKGELLEAPLYNRAWVFQERMLAPRILQFGHNQIFWECPSLSACEAFPKGLPRFLDATPREDMRWKQTLQRGSRTGVLMPANRTKLSLDNFWEVAVNAYTSCKLTFGMDKLIAIAGIANIILEGSGNTYAAGLWKTNIEEQLSWWVVDCKQADGQPSSRPADYRAPSWSWVSIDGLVQLRKNVYQPRDYKVAILDLDVKTVTPVPTGQVERGRILLRGHIGKMTFIRNSVVDTEWELKSGALRKSLFKVFLDVNPLEDVQEYYVLPVAYTEEPEERTLPGFSGHGLLLQQQQDLTCTFSRCGAFNFTGLSLEEWRAIEFEFTSDAEISEEYSAKLGHTINLI